MQLALVISILLFTNCRMLLRVVILVTTFLIHSSPAFENTWCSLCRTCYEGLFREQCVQTTYPIHDQNLILDDFDKQFLLDLSDNNLAHFPSDRIRQVTELKFLNLRNNRISNLCYLEIAADDLTSLTYLDLSGNELKSPCLTAFSHVKILKISTPELKSDLFSGFKQLEELHLSTSSPTIPGNLFKSFNKVRTLFLELEVGYQLPQDILSNNLSGSLRNLILIGKQITQSPSLTNLKSIEYLDLSLTNICQFDEDSFQETRSLQELYLDLSCQGTISERLFRGLLKLKTLHLKSKIKQIEPSLIQNLKFMTVLRMEDFQIMGLEEKEKRIITEAAIKLDDTSSDIVIKIPDNQLKYYFILANSAICDCTRGFYVLGSLSSVDGEYCLNEKNLGENITFPCQKRYQPGVVPDKSNAHPVPYEVTNITLKQLEHKQRADAIVHHTGSVLEKRNTETNATTMKQAGQRRVGRRSRVINSNKSTQIPTPTTLDTRKWPTFYEVNARKHVLPDVLKLSATTMAAATTERGSKAPDKPYVMWSVLAGVGVAVLVIAVITGFVCCKMIERRRFDKYVRKIFGGENNTSSSYYGMPPIDTMHPLDTFGTTQRSIVDPIEFSPLAFPREKMMTPHLDRFAFFSYQTTPGESFMADKRGSNAAEIHKSSVAADMRRSSIEADMRRNSVEADMRRNSVAADMRRSSVAADMYRNSISADLRRSSVPADMCRGWPSTKMRRFNTIMDMRRWSAANMQRGSLVPGLSADNRTPRSSVICGTPYDIYD